MAKKEVMMIAVIVRTNRGTIIYGFKRKGIKYLFCVLINKIKGYEVETVNV